MGKNEIRGFVIDAIIFVLFTVIAFVPPFAKTASFFVGYIFGVVAIAYQVYVFQISFKNGKDVKSKFYGFPIARIGVIYLVVQLVLSLIEMVLSKPLPAWVCILINVLLLGAVAVGCITADIMRDEIVRQDVVIKKDVNNMRKLQSMTASFVGMCQEADVKKNLQSLADEFKYSDPVSSDDTQELEGELIALVGEIQNALVDGDDEAVESLCKKVKANLAERNRICKLSK